MKNRKQLLIDLEYELMDQLRHSTPGDLRATIEYELEEELNDLFRDEIVFRLRCKIVEQL